MMPLPLLGAQWLLASVACTLAGLLAYALLHLATRAWPALRARRAAWLAAQAVIAAAALLPFLPRPEHALLAPTLHLAAAPASAPGAAAAHATTSATGTHNDTDGMDGGIRAVSDAYARGTATAAVERGTVGGTSALPAVYGVGGTGTVSGANTLRTVSSADATVSGTRTVRTVSGSDAMETVSSAGAIGAVSGASAINAASDASAIRALSSAGTMGAPDGAHAVGAVGALSIDGQPPVAHWSAVMLTSLMSWLSAPWAAIYLVGLAYAVYRVLRAHQLWRGLLATATRLSPQQLASHGAFDARQLAELARGTLTVLETDATVSPMLIGAWRPALLLPRHLRDFSRAQQHMIVAHELHHWRARDPFWLGMSAAIRTLFWFNPAARWCHDKTAWALELTCDQAVLAGRPQQQRKQYAASLLAQWKLQMAAMSAAGTGRTAGPGNGHHASHGIGHAHAIAFGAAGGDTVAARLRHMQHTALPALPAAAAWTVAASLTAVLAAGTLLQPALAINAPPVAAPPTAIDASASASTTSADTASVRWRAPLERMRVSSFFGVQRAVSAKPHPGIDLAAPQGTPVRAAAAGTVIAAGALAENDGRYGTTVVIETGAGQAWYAHLHRVAVKPGDRVVAGQLIGAVGRTGFATGPHLHFELRRDGRQIDPATVLASLDDHATSRALKARREQLGH